MPRVRLTMVNSNRLARAVVLVAVAGALGAGCGGAAPAPQAPSAAALEEAKTPEAALALLDNAEQAVNRSLGQPSQMPGFGQAQGYGPSAEQRAAEAPPPPAPPPPPPPSRSADKPAAQPAPVVVAPPPPAHPSKGASKDDDGERAKVRAQPGDGCETACSALASMARAADHVCGLAGATDERCTGARERVKNASQRVHASCPSCSAG